jgi:hypothetical protein
MMLYLFFEKKKFLYINKARFIATLFLAFLVFFPNILWNLNNSLSTFNHILYDNMAINKILFSVKNLLIFLLCQILIFGIFSSYILIKDFNWKNVDKIWIYFSFPIILLVSFQAFLNRALPYWAYLSFITLGVIIAIYEVNKKRIILSSIFNISIFVLFIFIHFLGFVRIEEKLDDEHVFKKIVPKIKSFLVCKKYNFLCVDRKFCGSAVYYLKDNLKSIEYYKKESQLRYSNYFHMNFSFTGKSEYIMLTNEENKSLPPGYCVIDEKTYTYKKLRLLLRHIKKETLTKSQIIRMEKRK